MGTLFDNPIAHHARHWVYLDKDRTHEVHVEVITDAKGSRFVTTEFAHRCLDPAEAVTHEEPIEAAWEIEVERTRVEGRLSRMGTYFRKTVGESRWHPLQSRPQTAPLGHAVSMPGGTHPEAKLGFHHFHDEKRSRDRLLLSVPRLDLAQPRFILADIAYEFPEINRGNLTIAHTRLTDITLRSVVSRADLDLADHGFRRLTTPLDYAAAYGADWRRTIPASIDEVTARVLAGRIGPGEAPRADPPVPLLGIHEARELLGDAALARLKRYLNEEEDSLWARGELGIRRFVSARRRTTSNAEQHELSALEAYLLVGYGFHSGNAQLVGVEGAKLARWAAHATGATQLA